MINYVMNSETKAAIVAALVEHGADRLALVGLGRIRREDFALATSSILSAWPTDADGMYRVALSDTAAYIVWRSYILAEIAADRGRRDNLAGYCARLGVTTEPAYHYVRAAARGCGVRICQDADGDHISWSELVNWIIERCDHHGPKLPWRHPIWRKRARAHRALADVGVVHREIIFPAAFCLCDQPQRTVNPPTLTPAESDALAGLAVYE